MSVNLVLSMDAILNGPKNLFLNTTLVNNEDVDYFVAMEAFHFSALHCGSPSISVVGPSQEYKFSFRLCANFLSSEAEEHNKRSFQKIPSGGSVEVHYNIPGSLSEFREYRDVEFTVPGEYTVLFKSHTSCCPQQNRQEQYCTAEIKEYVKLTGETKFEVFPNHFQTEQGEL